MVQSGETLGLLVQKRQESRPILPTLARDPAKLPCTRVKLDVGRPQEETAYSWDAVC